MAEACLKCLEVPGGEWIQLAPLRSLPGHCLSGHQAPGSECWEGYKQERVLGGRAGLRAVVFHSWSAAVKKVEPRQFTAKCNGAWLGCLAGGRGQLHCCNDAPGLSFPICHMRSWTGLPVTQILAGPWGKVGARHGCQGPEQRGEAAHESRSPAMGQQHLPLARGGGPRPREGTSGTEQQDCCLAWHWSPSPYGSGAT